MIKTIKEARLRVRQTRSANRKVKRISGFVMNCKTGHPSLAYWQHYEEVKSIGFTHNPDDIAQKKQLKRNVNPNDDGDCFVKTKIEHQKYNTYRVQKEKFKNYRVHAEDRELIDKLMGKKKRKQ